MPPRSPTIVGRAVDTIVWSSDARSIARRRPENVSRKRRRPGGGGRRWGWWRGWRGPAGGDVAGLGGGHRGQPAPSYSGREFLVTINLWRPHVKRYGVRR